MHRKNAVKNADNCCSFKLSRLYSQGHHLDMQTNISLSFSNKTNTHLQILKLIGFIDCILVSQNRNCSSITSKSIANKNP